MRPHRWKDFIFHVLLFLSALCPGPVSGAANFSQCLTNIIDCANNSSTCTGNIASADAFSLLRMSDGSRLILGVDAAEGASALSVSGCYEHCGGSEQEAFDWTVFSQEFAVWLLPYLALISQLPFGAQRRMDNLMSAVLTVGSPTLAGYSLFVTLLNARWVNDHLFSGINYPSAAVRQSVVRVLSSLQQVPLRVHPERSARFQSLVVHPDNDGWWTTFAAELDYSHTWSISSATSITWVFVAYLLTVADALSDVSSNINSNGVGTGSIWLWLLPIVVGWLVLSPKCDYRRVHDAYHKANRTVFVGDSYDPNSAPTPVTSNFGFTISPSPDWNANSNIISPDESRVPPVFNYARTLSWSRSVYVTSLYYRAAWRKAQRRVGVNGKRIPGNDVPRESRLGNRKQIIRYCQPDKYEHPGANVLWPRGVLFNMIVASLMSLLLQWGTTGAAILQAFYTPTIGLGCRSISYVIYGCLSNLVWMLLLLSSVLGYYARHLLDDLSTPDLERGGQSSEHLDDAIPMHDMQSPEADNEGEAAPLNSETTSINTIKLVPTGMMHARSIAACADWLRWIGKSIAIANAIFIVTDSIIQFANVYDMCYCDSSVNWWGSKAFNVIFPTQSDIVLALKAWCGALGLGLTCCAFFVGSMFLVKDSIIL